MRRFPVFLLAILSFSPSTVTAGEGADAPASDSPAVLIVLVGQDQAARDMEKRFVTELRLSIDGFSIQETRAPAEVFVDTALSRQISLIRPLMVEKRAIASMWLHSVSENVLLLQVVVLDTGRALVRLFEHALDEGSEAALAATAAELLGTAYLFEKERSERSKPIEALVESTRKQAGIAASSPPRWGLSLASIIGAGFTDSVGFPLGAGGLLGIERALKGDLCVGAGIGGTAGPIEKNSDYRIKGYEIPLSVDLFWGPRLKRVRLGPTVKLWFGLSNVSVRRPGLVRGNFSHWTFLGGLGLQLRVPIHQKVSLALAAGLSATPNRLEIRLRSSGDTVYRRGILCGWGSLGVLIVLA